MVSRDVNNLVQGLISHSVANQANDLDVKVRRLVRIRGQDRNRESSNANRESLRSNVAGFNQSEQFGLQIELKKVEV